MRYCLYFVNNILLSCSHAPRAIQSCRYYLYLSVNHNITIYRNIRGYCSATLCCHGWQGDDDTISRINFYSVSDSQAGEWGESCLGVQCTVVYSSVQWPWLGSAQCTLQLSQLSLLTLTTDNIKYLIFIHAHCYKISSPKMYITV